MKIDVPGMALRRANARPMTGSAKQSIEPRRHCERSEAIHRAAAVIASAVKQSIAPRKERMDCFAALAMTSKRTFASSPRNAPRGVDETFADGRPAKAGRTTPQSAQSNVSGHGRE